MTNGLSTNAEKKSLLFDGHALAFHSWLNGYNKEVMPGFFGMLGRAMQRLDHTRLIVTFDPPPRNLSHKL